MNLMEEDLNIKEMIEYGIFDKEEFHKVSNEVWEILESRCKRENRSVYITNIINILVFNFGRLFAHFKMDKNESKKFTLNFILLLNEIHDDLHELYEQIDKSEFN